MPVWSFTSSAVNNLVAEIDDLIFGFALGSIIDKERSAYSYGYLEWIGFFPNPDRSPVEVEVLRGLFFGEDIVVYENRIYVVNRETGFYILELRNQ